MSASASIRLAHVYAGDSTSDIPAVELLMRHAHTNTKRGTHMDA